MFNEFVEYCSNVIGLKSGDKILLTVSGGADSMVMLHLFERSDYEISVAHCNFNLRGEESERDTAFVKDYCDSNDVRLFVKYFNTAEYAAENGISVQMAARDLRYRWFEQLRQKLDYDYIATAHHLDDQAETFFINLVRGTGIAGLHGIRPVAGRLIRPLLFARRMEIEKYASEHNLDFVDDSSNFSDKYLRNHIRHNILPMFDALNPKFITNLARTIDNIAGIERAFKHQTQILFNSMLKIEGDKIIINIPKLLEIDNLDVYLSEFLLQYGFNADAIKKIYDNLKSDKSGLRFFSDSFRLIKDRNDLIITPLQDENNDNRDDFFIVNEDFKGDFPVEFSFEITGRVEEFSTDNSTAYFDFDKLRFPLVLRKWENGDFFYPFGMNGKKLVSDLFTDLKISVIDKENIWIMCSGTDIIWVVGYRSDNRYRVDEKTEKILILKVDNGVD